MNEVLIAERNLFLLASGGQWSVAVLRATSLHGLMASVPELPHIQSRDLAMFGCSGAADPFAIQRDNVWYLFFEAFMNSSSNATIGCARSHDLVSWEQLGVVLQQKHHLSYPFVFEFDGQIYMMPESKSVRRVDIYKAVEFPLRWEYVKTILSGRLMDASMFQYGGRYWIFAGYRSYWLKLFYADNPLGPWRSHWLPTVGGYNKSRTRPGGRPVMIDGSLIRLSQDNTKHYGHQLRAWQVKTLNRLWYRDTPALQRPLLQPTGSGWAAQQMHHADIHPQSDGSLIAFVDGA